MKLDNRGFAISSIMYIILVFAVILIAVTLSVLSNKKLILDKLKNEAIKDIHDDTICIAVNSSLTGTVATNDSTGKRIYNVGDEYLCQVKSGVKYTFFVLSENSESVNLIMNRNINSDGTLAHIGITQVSPENGVYNLVPWISSSDYISSNIDNTVCYGDSCVDEGPITVMNFLNNATRSWNNIENLNEEVSVKNINDDLTLIDSSVKVNLNGKARLPYVNEIISTGCKVKTVNSCPLWMVNYLYESDNYTNVNKTSIPGIVGYWSLDVNSSAAAWSVGASADVWGTYGYVTTHGVRPVIKVSKDKIK